MSIFSAEELCIRYTLYFFINRKPLLCNIRSNNNSNNNNNDNNNNNNNNNNRQDETKKTAT